MKHPQLRPCGHDSRSHAKKSSLTVLLPMKQGMTGTGPACQRMREGNLGHVRFSHTDKLLHICNGTPRSPRVGLHCCLSARSWLPVWTDFLSLLSAMHNPPPCCGPPFPRRAGVSVAALLEVMFSSVAGLALLGRLNTWSCRSASLRCSLLSPVPAGKWRTSQLGEAISCRGVSR